MAKRERLGEFLVRSGVITAEELHAALEQQARTGALLGETLVSLGFISREVLMNRLADFYGVPYVSLRMSPPDPATAKMVSARLAHRYRLIPVRRQGDTLLVAMANPADVAAEDELRALTGMDITPALADADEIDDAIGRIFDVMQNAERAIRNRAASQEAAPEVEAVPPVEEGPIVGLVQSLLVKAVRERASDIHVEPQANDVRVRYRVDGMLREVMRQEAALHPAIVTRIKVMAGMDIAERRLPQDGRFAMTVDGRSFDFRVSTLPSQYGEKAVLRLLEKTGGIRTLEQLGFAPDIQKRLEAVLSRPHGLFLVVGPTGSGKSTTLSAALSYLNRDTVNIVTVEDPIEYEIPGACQTQVNPRAGLTFARALRSILRQDPDVIMVGEIRDRETAEMAIQAALTGHMVLSTLHTNDAPSTVARLLDMGVEPVLLASSLAGVLSQRLVRLLCPHCREPYTVPEGTEIAGWRPEPGQTIYRPASKPFGEPCKHCIHGYAGRTVVTEFMEVNNEIRELILNRASTGEVRRAAIANGMVPIRMDGIRRVLAGETSLEEVLRVTDHSQAESDDHVPHAAVAGG